MEQNQQVKQAAHILYQCNFLSQERNPQVIQTADKQSGQYETFVQCCFTLAGVSEQIHTDRSANKKHAWGFVSFWRNPYTQFQSQIYQDLTSVLNIASYDNINPLTPNDSYVGRTAPLTSRRCILYIYSTNIRT